MVILRVKLSLGQVISNNLRFLHQKEFGLGTVVRGLSSNTQAVILKKWDFDAEITTGVGAYCSSWLAG